MPLQSSRGAASAKAFGFTVGGGGLLVDFMLIAGGGGGGNDCGGGGGAGGYRASFPGGTQFTLAIGNNPITIGGGGTAGMNSYPFSGGNNSSPGVNSTLSNGITTITAAGGGGGGSGNAFPGTPGNAGLAGGSGGGDSSVITPTSATRAGNTPPVSPPQGNPSSVAGNPAFNRGGGGGGSSTAGVVPGNGGGGTDVTSVFGSSPQPFYGPTAGVYGGGAGGGAGGPPGATGGTGGTGGGGAGYNYGEATNPAKGGVVNSGGGGGGYGQRAVPGQQFAGAGGSGVALIFAPAAIAPRVSVSPGTNTKTTVPTGAVLRFTVDGNITVT